ncbi:hypothetical protein MNBD_GAMMA18-2291 [hydrothermal vent metagenome]|uniref:Uncharacterized protein n=1 Tax=hydrothermal vent metagenome TaxID=652676 RepID=A0A3B0Z9F7_9ZZZZ
MSKDGSKGEYPPLSLKDEVTDFLLYTAPNSEVKVEVLLNDETLWLACRKPTQIRAEYFPVFGFLSQQRKLGAFSVKYTVYFLAPNISSLHGVSDLRLV